MDAHTIQERTAATHRLPFGAALMHAQSTARMPTRSESNPTWNERQRKSVQSEDASGWHLLLRTCFRMLL
jgi:hypothetical protein